MNELIIEEVLIALRRVIRATDMHSRDLVKSSGLTAPQLLILQSIHGQRDPSVGDVANSISLSQATVSSILDRMETKGLVERRKSSTDKRKVKLLLTTRGKQAVKGAPVPLQEKFVQRFSALENWEQTQMLSTLQRIAQMMDARTLDAAPLLDIGSPDRQATP